MYKIITTSGETFLTEKPNFIRVHKNGVTFLLTDQARAEGVAYHGTPYLWKDGAQCHEVDGAEMIAELQAENDELKAIQADTDEMVVDHEYRMTLLESSSNV